jgi:hypothetical protein
MAAFINRDGTASIRKLAQQMCILVNTFEPIMRSNYGTNPTFLAALTAAKTACTLVPLLDELQVEFEPPVGDFPSGDDIPGTNPGRPLPPDPPPV